MKLAEVVAAAVDRRQKRFMRCKVKMRVQVDGDPPTVVSLVMVDTLLRGGGIPRVQMEIPGVRQFSSIVPLRVPQPLALAPPHLQLQVLAPGAAMAKHDGTSVLVNRD